MPKVTDIQVQKRRKDRVSIFLDGEFWTGMSQNCFLELGLESGQELTKERVREIEKRVVSDSALTYALNRLGYGMVSEAKLREKLKEREYGDAVCDEVIAQCRDLALVNDEYLAETLATEMREKGMGRGRAADKLREKGLPKDLADRALDEAFPDADEHQLARRSLQMKYGEEPLDRRTQQRVLGFLTRRGFSLAIAQAVIAEQSLDEEAEAALHSPDEARELLRRKYGKDELSRDEQRKAYGYLARRGFTSRVISLALSGAED